MKLRRLSRTSFSRVWLPYAVLAGALIVTFLAAFYVHRTTLAKDRLRFENSVQQITSVVDDRLDTYEALLRSGAGLFAASDNVQPDEFHRFVTEIDLASHYKGIQGLGFLARLQPNERDRLVRLMHETGNPTFKIWPGGDRPEYYPIVYLEPLDRRNQQAIGYDMSTEDVRRRTMEQARDSGSPVASGRVTLVQEIDEPKQFGFLIYMPVYRHGAKVETVDDRRAALLGFVYAPFRAGDLMQTILSDRTVTGIKYKVFDGLQKNDDNLLYDSHSSLIEPGRFGANTTINVSNSLWTLEFSSTPDFEAVSAKMFSTLALLVGGLLSFLLYAITRLQTVAQSRAESAVRELRFSDQSLRNSLKERKEAEAAVLRSKEELQLANYRFRVAEEASKSFNYDWNLATDSVVRSENFSQVLGYGPDEIAPTWDAWKAISHPDDFPISKEEAIAYLNNLDGDLLESEYRVRHKDGSYRNLYNRGLILRDERGKALRVIGQTVDITDRKFAETELLAANERYRELFENANDIVYTLDLEGRLTSVNKAGETITGFSATELLGRSITSLLTEESVPVMRQMLERKLGGETRTDYELEIQTKDGKRRTLEISSRLRHEHGQPTGVQGIARDITERKLAEEEIRAANERALIEYERLLERIDALAQALGAARELLPIYRALRDFVTASLPCNGLFVSLYDATNDVRTASYAWGDGMEHDVSQLPPMPITDGPNSRAVRTGEVIITTEFMKSTAGHRQVIVGPENNLRPESSMAVPMSVLGRIVGTIELQCYDCNAYKETHGTAMRMAANLTAVAIENARLLARETEARAEAEESNRLKDEFLATVSHELRTPLTAILGWARMLDSETFDADQKQRAIQTIQRNAKAQAEIIDDILDVSRIITGNLYLNLEPTELAPVIEAALNVVRPTAETKHIKIDADFAGEPALVSADAHRMQQVIWNLVSNAVKFTPPGGRVSVRTYQANGFVNLEVRDTGQGINGEFLPHVFERFRQADSSTTRQHGGLGLGLAIVRHLVEIHGGSVQAHSDGEGKGALFTVTLPLIADQITSLPTLTPAQITRVESAVKLTGVHVLVVDDDPGTRDMIAAALNERQARVTVVGSAREALTEINRSVPDVLISDIAMPVEDGYKLIEQVRELCVDEGNPIPAIAITAYAREEDRRRALAAGYHSYLPKPIEPAELLAAIAALLTNGGARIQTRQ